MPKERKLQRLPDKQLLSSLVAFAKERGSQAKRKGSCAPYIWIALEIARKCRLRGIEVFSMTGGQIIPEGVVCERRKGSRDNITRYDPTLKNAISEAQKRRNKVWQDRGRAIPFKAENRLLLVNTSDNMISQRTWQTAWRRFLELAISEKLITKDDCVNFPKK